MSADKKSPPPIKKIIKKGHGGHHGGSWKVAYADFVTAMMAFFLVMWLLAISSEQGKAALADYFENLSLTDAIFNGGLPSAFDPSKESPGILEGGCFQLKEMGKELDEREKALDEREKALTDRSDSRPDMAATRPTDRPQDPNLTDLPEGQEGGEGSTQTGIAPGEGADTQGAAPGDGAGYQVTPGMGQGTAEQAREAKARLASELTTAVANNLGGAAGVEGQFMVEYVPGGLKIQLLDKEGRPMFVSGQPRLTPLAQLILTTVAEKLNTIPNKIAIEGHTDAVATTSQELTNWELSTARASAARRFLSRHGITDNRLTMVAGYSSTQPLAGTNPTDPVNRRVGIMIWDEPPQPEPQAPEPTPAPEPETQAAPSAGGPATPPRQPQQPPRPATPLLAPQRPSQESLEQMLLDETLRRAATPDGAPSGPPPAPNGQ